MTALVVEKKTLLESLDNDAQLLKEVIAIFLADYPGRMSELRAAVIVRNPDTIASGSHSLRGSVGTFGARAAVEAAQKLESMGRHGNMGGVDDAFSVLEREMALVVSALEQIAKDAL
ncbi:MAG: Hpt domain-containing protein [Candidatus Acidiferrales bacterium]|jgi:HPt (histidine-containing phosphotransfer) domain-containing protein